MKSPPRRRACQESPARTKEPRNGCPLRGFFFSYPGTVKIDAAARGTARRSKAEKAGGAQARGGNGYA